MSVRDVAAETAILDLLLGDGAGAGAPSAFRFLLFHGDPNTDGVELDAVGGYTPLVLANTTANFPDAVDGMKAVPVAFADATDAFSDTTTHWQMVDDDNPTVGWFNGEWANEIDVAGAGPVSGVATIYVGNLS
jgi:hypothetical protein